MKDESMSTSRSVPVASCGSAAVVRTPCCVARVFLRPDEAVPGAVLNPAYPHDGVDWALVEQQGTTDT
jgi:hypothetical protein